MPANPAAYPSAATAFVSALAGHDLAGYESSGVFAIPCADGPMTGDFKRITKIQAILSPASKRALTNAVSGRVIWSRQSVVHNLRAVSTKVAVVVVLDIKNMT